MKTNYINHHFNVQAKKQIKNIKGYYTHFIASFLILPFIIFINLKTVPQFHWFWFAIAAWCIGLCIHWLFVFGFSTINFTNNWENKKIKEIMGSDFNPVLEYEEPLYPNVHYYSRAKKQTQAIRNFYIQLIVFIIAFPVIVMVNLQFVPSFHFFWFALGGMSIATFFHWLEVFGFEFFGFGAQWEQKKIIEILNKYKQNETKF